MSLSNHNYKFNVKNSLSLFKNKLKLLGFDPQIEQSPYSNSCYISLNENFTIRVSDHELGFYAIRPIIHSEIISQNGNFHFNNLWFNRIIKDIDFYKTSFKNEYLEYNIFSNGIETIFKNKDNFISFLLEIGFDSFYLFDYSFRVSYEKEGVKYEMHVN